MNKRIDHLEFRWAKLNETDRYPEIVQWCNRVAGDSYCYTLLYWVQDSEGWNVKFVGSRPFDDSKFDHSLLWHLMQYGQSVADAEFKLTRFQKEYAQLHGQLLDI